METNYKQILKNIRNFIRSDEKVLEQQYKGKSANPTRYAHKIVLRNPFVILRWLLILFSSILPASDFKNNILRILGVKIGKDVSIGIGAFIDLMFPQLLTIEDGALIGAGSLILTHELTIKRIRLGRVRIGKNALIGIRSVIRSGVTIGNHAVVGANSFVNKDVQDYEFVGGVPAKRVKMLKEEI